MKGKSGRLVRSDSSYKNGDITKTGYEVAEVGTRPEYKLRKRIQINKNSWNPDYIGKNGWIYTHLCYYWVELDEYPNKQFKFREIELDM